MDKEKIRSHIEDTFKQVIEESGTSLTEDLSDSTVLLESGLDSLGFAILVARLDEELGWDPFTISSEAVYPHTFEKFVAFYADNQP